METKCAPSYANMFMGIFEEKFKYPLANNMTRLYLRFIDDILMDGNNNQLLKFKQRINEVHPFFKFVFKFSNKEISFLDTIVYKKPTNKFETKLYTNGTDRQAYLHRKSEHPESLKRNIQFAQTLRLRRICKADK